MEWNLRTLYEAIQQEDHEQVYTVANKVLSSNATDMDAITCKVIAKVNMGDMEGALAIAEASPRIANKLYSIRAYIHYRLGHFSEALKLIKSAREALDKNATEDTISALKHIEAQTYYKMNRFSDAAAVYESFVLSSDSLLDDPEHLVNVLAAYASAGLTDKLDALVARIGLDRKVQQASSSAAAEQSLTYELVFNYACALIAAGRYKAALAAVQLAQQILRDSHAAEMGDADEQEYMSELAVMELQRAYTVQLLGDSAAAQDAYTALLASNSAAAPAVRAVAVNNQLCASVLSADSAASGLKRLEAAIAQAGDKLSAHQRSTLKLNCAVLLAWGKRGKEARDVLDALLQDPTANVSPVDAAYVRVFSHVREKAFPEAAAALEVVAAALKEHKQGSVREEALLELSRVQLLLASGDSAGAVATFEEAMRTGALHMYDANIRVAPAVSAWMMAVCERTGDMKGLSAELDRAVSTWSARAAEAEKQGGVSGAAYRHAAGILHQLQVRGADVKAKEGDYTGAMRMLEGLCAAAKARGEDPAVVQYSTQLLALAVRHAPERVSQYAEALPAVDVSDVDVAALEAAGVSALTAQSQGSDGAAGKEGMYLPSGKRAFTAEKLQQVRERKRAKRRPQLPKGLTAEQAAANVKAGFTPDPYRWKPKWERPQVGKSKDKLAHVYKGPQGSGVSESKLEVGIPAAAAATKVAKGGKGGRRRK